LVIRCIKTGSLWKCFTTVQYQIKVWLNNVYTVIFIVLSQWMVELPSDQYPNPSLLNFRRLKYRLKIEAKFHIYLRVLILILASLKSSAKRRPVIITLHLILFAFIANIVVTHSDFLNAVKVPPSSLSQWYKPENKRQVWLHNMFKLRREMQAVEFYAQMEDPVRLNKWAERLNEHYFKIAEMVPEWKDKLSSQLLSDLNEQVEHNKFNDIPKTLEVLSQNCQSCHTDYRVTTAALYRSPDFSGITLSSGSDASESVPYTQHMDMLSKQVNKIKIASADAMSDLALTSLSELVQGMNTLGTTCSNCHKNEIEAYPTLAMTKTIKQLEESLETGTLKDQGRALGTLAVQACARCHGTHRMSYDAGKQLSNKMDWGQLIKH